MGFLLGLVTGLGAPLGNWSAVRWLSDLILLSLVSIMVGCPPISSRLMRSWLRWWWSCRSRWWRCGLITSDCGLRTPSFEPG
jgi:hypothetical protein